MNTLVAPHKIATKMDTQLADGFSQLTAHYDEKYKINWLYMHASPRPCFSPALLGEIHTLINGMKADMQATQQQKYEFLVVASKVEGTFNLGGDLSLFTQLIRDQNYAGLLDYAIKGIDLVYHNNRHFDLEMTTISLIQGDALGGGFEAALSSNVIIAERGVKMGLPEVLFNLFPGMGAYSILARKMTPKAAEKMILSGKIYTAEEMYELGVVDILAEPGEGELAVYRYVESTKRSANTHQAMRKVVDICNSLNYQEMIDIAEVWAAAALKLTEKDLRMMHRLIQRQTAKSQAQAQSESTSELATLSAG